jgi:hypothetical protein
LSYNAQSLVRQLDRRHERTKNSEKWQAKQRKFDLLRIGLARRGVPLNNIRYEFFGRAGELLAG